MVARLVWYDVCYVFKVVSVGFSFVFKHELGLYPCH
jgi:hypothetical protein